MTTIVISPDCSSTLKPSKRPSYSKTFTSTLSSGWRQALFRESWSQPSYESGPLAPMGGIGEMGGSKHPDELFERLLALEPRDGDQSSSLG